MHRGNFYSVSFNFFFFALSRYNYSKKKKKKRSQLSKERGELGGMWEAAAGLSQDWWTQATSLDSRLSGSLSDG